MASKKKAPTAKQKAARNTHDRARRKQRAASLTAGQRAAKAETRRKLWDKARAAGIAAVQTPEGRAKKAELAKAQWADPADFLREQHRAGMAAHRREPPPHAAELIRAACSEYGANLTQLCELLQCHPQTLAGWRKRFPEIEDAVVQGRRIEEDKLWGKLFQQAMGGNTVACIVSLKMKYGHRDSGPIPGAAADGPTEQAARIRESLRQMRQADGDFGGNENVPIGGNYRPC
jgi:hypothetical protein